MKRRVRMRAAGTAAAVLIVASTDIASAAYRLCALRDGTKGPCTCEVVGGAPGEYVVAPRSQCRAAKPAAATAPAAPPDTDATVTPPPQPAATAPAGSAENAPAAPAVTPAASTPRKLVDIRARGKVLCGINTDLLGFSKQTEAGQWTGLDADFCRAVAAAVFADPGKVEFVPVETAQRFEALSSGKIDLLSRNTTWTMDRDVTLGAEFAGIIYYDGQGFLTSDERGLVSAQQLGGATVCVESGTTSEANMAYYFKAHKIDVTTKTFAARADLIKAYLDGTCDALSGDRSGLYSDRASFPEPERHAVLPEVISKEPLGPVVLQSDREWIEVVRWTLFGLVNAEEVGLDKSAAGGSAALTDDALRLVEGAGKSGEALGLSRTWLRDVVAATGHYGEMFETNLGKGAPLGMERGINALWKRGGLLYAPPMW